MPAARWICLTSPTPPLHRKCFANAQGRADRQAKPPGRTEEPSISYDSCFNNNTKHLISCFSLTDSSFSQGTLYLHESPQPLALICFGRLPLPQSNEPPTTSSSSSMKKGPEKFKTITMPLCQPGVPASSSCKARVALSCIIFKTYNPTALFCPDQCGSFILTSSRRAESTHISPNLPCSLLRSHQQKTACC